MPTTRHNVRIAKAQAAQLRGLAHTGWLQQTSKQLSGMRGGLAYQPTVLLQSARHDGLLQIGTVELQAELYHLPLAEHRALMAGSPGYAAYPDTEERVGALLSALTTTEQHAWFDDLVRSVQAGRVQYPAACEGMVWCPEGTRLVQLGSLWFLSLSFAATPARLPREGRREHLGLDVGLRPLAVAVSSSGTFRPAPVCWPHVVEPRLAALPGSLQPAVRSELERMQYMAARLSLTEFTTRILATARSVAAEHLDLTSFESDFPARGRREAVIDWHQAWLPQALHVAGLPPLVRVPPYGTSQYCHRCRRQGQRDGAKFTCERCGVQDAHANAGHNILNRSWAVRRLRTQGRP